MKTDPQIVVILASTGPASDHIDHIKTQCPYSMVVVVISMVAYL